MWLPSGYLASGAADGTVNIWHIYPSASTMHHANEEGGLAKSTTAGSDRAVAPVFIDSLKLHRRAVTGVAFRLGTYSERATKTLRTQTSHSSAGDVSTLITASEDSTIRVWNIASPQVVDTSTPAGRSSAARLTASMIHCVDRYFGHRGPVACISTLKKERCATGGGTYSLCSTSGVRTAQGGGGGVCDSTMRFWKLDTATQSEYSVAGTEMRRLTPNAEDNIAAAATRAAKSAPGLENLDLSLNSVECVAMLDDVHVAVGTSSGLLLLYDITKNNTVFPNMAQAPLIIPDRGNLGKTNTASFQTRTSLYNVTARHAALIQVVVCPHGSGFTGDGTGVEALQTTQAPGKRAIGNAICSMAAAPYSDLLATASGGGDVWSVGKQATTIVLWNVVNDFLAAAAAANGAARGPLPKTVVGGVTLPPVRLDAIARISMPCFAPRPTAGIPSRPTPVSAGFATAMNFSLDGSVLVVALAKEQRLGRWLTDRDALNGVAVIPVFQNAVPEGSPVSSAYTRITNECRARLGVPALPASVTTQTVVPPLVDPSHTPARLYEIPTAQKAAAAAEKSGSTKLSGATAAAAAATPEAAAAPKGKRSNKGALKREKEDTTKKVAVPTPKAKPAAKKATGKKPAKK